MPRYGIKRVLRRLYSQVPNRMCGHIWTQDLFGHVDEFFRTPKIHESLDTENSNLTVQRILALFDLAGQKKNLRWLDDTLLSHKCKKLKVSGRLI